MVVIRLTRGGTNKRPFYHIIVTDKRKPRDSGHLEQLGFFNPIAKGGEIPLKLNKERFAYWLSCGAKPSERVLYLVKNFETKGGKDSGSSIQENTPACIACETNIEQINPETAV